MKQILVVAFLFVTVGVHAQTGLDKFVTDVSQKAQKLKVKEKKQIKRFLRYAPSLDERIARYVPIYGVYAKEGLSQALDLIYLRLWDNEAYFNEISRTNYDIFPTYLDARKLYLDYVLAYEGESYQWLAYRKYVNRKEQYCDREGFGPLGRLVLSEKPDIVLVLFGDCQRILFIKDNVLSCYLMSDDKAHEYRPCDFTELVTTGEYDKLPLPHTPYVMAY